MVGKTKQKSVAKLPTNPVDKSSFKIDISNIPSEINGIPTTPPKRSTTQGKTAQQNIYRLITVCNKLGFNSKGAISGLLGVCGGESKWMPVSENYKWSAERLISCGLFKPMPPEDARKYANSNNPAEFFGWLYGSRIGKDPVAAGKYYGRGFIQLTGIANYARYSELLNYNLVDNPDDALDPDISAHIAVTYLMDRIKNWQTVMHQPGMFEVVQGAINRNERSGDNYNLKYKYYTYFMGGVADPPSSDKQPTTTTPTQTAKQIADANPIKKEAYTEDRSKNSSTIGFTDPDGQYPLRDYMNEPDTNRLARGIVKGTHIEFKDSRRKSGIEIANGGSYDQPYSAYNASYPYNKVFESESGHVLEFDDSPAGERVNLYHSKGTFTEIDANGTQVNFIVGDAFWITERNGNIYVQGTCNLTAEGNINILCKSEANIEVNGDVNATFHSKANIGVADDLNLAIGGSFNVLVEENFNLEVSGTSSVRTAGKMVMSTDDQLLLKTSKSVNIQGGNSNSSADTVLKLSGNMAIEVPGTYQIKAKSVIFDTETISYNGSTRIDLNPKGFKPLTALGSKTTEYDFYGNESSKDQQVLVDTIKFNPDITKASAKGSSSENHAYLSSVETTALGLVVPDLIGAKSTNNVNLEPPTRKFSDIAKFETEEDWSTQAGSKTATKTFTGDEYTSIVAKDTTTDRKQEEPLFTAETPKVTTINSLPDDTIKRINNTGSFDKNYRLSDHFTLGMLIDTDSTLKNVSIPYPKVEARAGTENLTKSDIVTNLTYLAVNILEPLYAMLGQQAGDFGISNRDGLWRISSGLRNGTNGSDHNRGCAVDIQLSPRKSHKEMYEFAQKLESMFSGKYNQMILEYRRPGAQNNHTGRWQNWIHISYNHKGNKNMKFTMLDDKTYKKNEFVILE